MTLVNAYVPLIGATMLAVGLAGAEWQVFLQRAAAERQSRAAEQDRAGQFALERQRTFNRLWQALADSRGKTSTPESVMQELAQLFAADLVAVWAATESNGGFCLRGVHPAATDLASRLDKIAQASPCFERLREAKHELHVANFAKETSPALSMLCEEKSLQQAVLCPVLVREELVGVLAFFYQKKPQVSSILAEEMQAAANLFLCAL